MKNTFKQIWHLLFAIIIGSELYLMAHNELTDSSMQLYIFGGAFTVLLSMYFILKDKKLD